MAEYEIPGLAVGVVMDGETYVFTTGLANAKTGTPVTTDTLFELGSVSKLFTVTLAAEAERDGVLALDEPDRRVHSRTRRDALRRSHPCGARDPFHRRHAAPRARGCHEPRQAQRLARQVETGRAAGADALLFQSQHRPPRRDRRRPAGHLLRGGDGGRTLPRARARRTPSSASPRSGWRTTPWAPTATAAPRG